MLDILPEEIRRAYDRLPKEKQQKVLELRFRRDRPVTAVFSPGEEVLPGNVVVTGRMLEDLLDRATGFSPYSLKMEETGLYLPVKGGGRLGLCGEVTVKNGQIHSLRQISSASLRFARAVWGIGQAAADRLTEGGEVASALIVSSPGGGKTTFLRDLIRCVSEKGYRVSVADERREISAMDGGRTGLGLGPCTDVLCGCPKERAIPLLIRAMNPQIVAVDELSGEREVEEVLYASFSGVAVFATVHGSGRESLLRRPLYRKLLESGGFTWLIFPDREGEATMERVDAYDEGSGSGLCGGSIHDGRTGRPTKHQQTSVSAQAVSYGAGDHAGRNGIGHASGGRFV